MHNFHKLRSEDSVHDLTYAGEFVWESWSSGVWTVVGSRATWVVAKVVDRQLHLAENTKVDEINSTLSASTHSIGIGEFNSASITYACLLDQ